MTFSEYLQGLGRSRETIRVYNFYLLDFLGWLDGQSLEAEAVTAGDLMAYLNRLKQKEMANVSRSNYLIALNHFFNWQQQRELRDDNPARRIKIRGVKTRKLYHILTREELEGLYHSYDAARPPRGKPATFRIQQLIRQRNKAMLGLIVYQGLLTTEINSLTVKDLKLREGKIFIEGSRKSEARTLDLRPQQIMELLDYQQTTRAALLAYGAPDRELLFLPAPASGQRTATQNDGINIWKRLTLELKTQQPKLTNLLHVRTSVITHWLKSHNLREVQYMAGHRYVSTTEGYQINQIEDLQQDIDRFHLLG